MRKLALTVLIILMGFALLGCAGADKREPDPMALLTAVTISDITIEENMVNVHIDGVYTPSFTVHKPSDPFSVIINMPGVDAGTLSDKIFSEKPGIAEVRVSRYDAPEFGVELEVLLENPAFLESDYHNNVLVLKVVESSPDVMARDSMKPATAITGVEFNYSDDKVNVVINSNGIIEPELYQLDKRLIVDIPDVGMQADIPEKFLFPVKAMRAGDFNGTLRLVLDLKQDSEFQSETIDEKLVISFEIAPEDLFLVIVDPDEGLDAEQEAAAEPEEETSEYGAGFSGSLISLDFQDAEIKPIIRLLAGDVGGFNVVLNPQVAGSINLKLKDVPWDKALDIILKQNNLEWKADGNIMSVAPSSVFRQIEQEEARRKATQEQIAPIVPAIIPLTHTTVDEITPRIKAALTSRGRAETDSRTNTITVYDTLERITMIKRDIVPQFDTPAHKTQQVMIEAKIVEVSTDYSKQFGIRWSGSGDQDDFGLSNASSVGFGINTPLSGFSDAPGGILNLGYAETFEINMSLAALESMGKTKKLANPRVLTIDKMPAVIKQGLQIPYTTQGSEGSQTDFKEAVLKLEVTPEIQPNGEIRLQVVVTNNTPVQRSGTTAINNQEINTQAYIRDGDTLVLGGIYTNTEEEKETRVPILGRIPLIGWLFKTYKVSNNPNELLVFITPRIIR